MGFPKNLGCLLFVSIGAAWSVSACGGIIAGSDAGAAADDGGTDASAEASEYDTPGVCTSGVTGTSSGSSTMRPGEACISCHATSGGGPLYKFMGTVYPTAHEPDNCVGASSATYAGTQIVITDAKGVTFTLTPNSAGNFLGPSAGTPVMPYQAKVTYQGRERVMVTPQTSGDCNACHTETGTNGAPGRVMLP